MLRTVLIAGAASLAMVGGAIAQTASTTTDLNMRTGPGGQYEVILTMPRGADVPVMGCTEAGTWCKVSYDGREGFAASQYLLVKQDGTTVVVAERPSLFQSVVAEPVEAVAGAGAAVVGALAGAVTGVVEAITPEPRVVTYIETNPTEVVYLDGEVVVGAVVPAEVELYAVPDYNYRYAYINSQAVLVEPTSREIVYVYR